jgi:hypothetical protein
LPVVKKCGPANVREQMVELGRMQSSHYRWGNDPFDPVAVVYYAGFRRGFWCGIIASAVLAVVSLLVRPHW